MSAANTWSHGYPVDETYPPSWHSFLSPAWLRAACAVAGVAWEVDSDSPLSIADVGCGVGFSALLIAAGSPSWRVTGLDYNPAHVAEGASLARQAQLPNVEFAELDLADADNSTVDALPVFDIVLVHGLWSWVSDAVREGVLRLVRRRLKTGGVVLLSYNAMPGASSSMALARLVRESLHASSGGELGLQTAGRRVRELVEAKATHLSSSPWLTMFAEGDAPVRAGYLLHEFSTEHWRPCFHADVASAMTQAHCDYAGTATLDENFPNLSLSPAQLDIWQAATDSPARELIFDLSVKRLFRRDIYVRGLRRVPRSQAVDRLQLVLTDPKPGVSKLKTQLGEAELPEQVVVAVREALRSGPQRIADLRALSACSKVTPEELLVLAVGSGLAHPVWHLPGEGTHWKVGIDRARALNRVLADRFAPFGFGAATLGLATPFLGGALRSNPQGLAVARRLLDWQAFVGQQPVSVDALVGTLLPPGEQPSTEVMAGMRDSITEILDTSWPVWRSLGIV